MDKITNNAAISAAILIIPIALTFIGIGWYTLQPLSQSIPTYVIGSINNIDGGYNVHITYYFRGDGGLFAHQQIKIDVYVQYDKPYKGEPLMLAFPDARNSGTEFDWISMNDGNNSTYPIPKVAVIHLNPVWNKTWTNYTNIYHGEGQIRYNYEGAYGAMLVPEGLTGFDMYDVIYPHSIEPVVKIGKYIDSQVVPYNNFTFSLTLIIIGFAILSSHPVVSNIIRILIIKRKNKAQKAEIKQQKTQSVDKRKTVKPIRRKMHKKSNTTS